jgi:hypothetical protein
VWGDGDGAAVAAPALPSFAALFEQTLQAATDGTARLEALARSLSAPPPAPPPGAAHTRAGPVMHGVAAYYAYKAAEFGAVWAELQGDPRARTVHLRAAVRHLERMAHGRGGSEEGGGGDEMLPAEKRAAAALTLLALAELECAVGGGQGPGPLLAARGRRLLLQVWADSPPPRHIEILLDSALRLVSQCSGKGSGEGRVA